MKHLLQWIVATGGLLLVSEVVVGVHVEGFYIALILALVLGLLHLIVRPVLLFLTLPITLLTFGLFSFVINALLFWLASTFIDGFEVTGFIPAFIGSAALSLILALWKKLIEGLD